MPTEPVVLGLVSRRRAGYRDQPFARTDLLSDSCPFEQIGTVGADALASPAAATLAACSRNHSRFHQVSGHSGLDC